MYVAYTLSIQQPTSGIIVTGSEEAIPQPRDFTASNGNKQQP